MASLTRREFLQHGGAATAGTLAGLAALGWARGGEPAGRVFRAGAFAQDITPDWFPVLVNGSFLSHEATKVNDPLHARCLVLDDGATRLGIIVVDLCLMDRALMDRIKVRAAERTGIRADRILMTTTHTHSAPSAVGALGTEPDEKYVAFLPDRVAEGLRRAEENLAPAKVGWGVGRLAELAQCRRWIARPDKIGTDPFGGRACRAMMHPGFRNPDFEGPSGPMDPSVSVLAVASPEGAPIALLAAYSIHYVGSPPLSADYYGVFAEKIAERVGPGDPKRPFVGILANGTSGDAYVRDYGGEPKDHDRLQVAQAVAEVAHHVYRSMEMHDWAPLVLAERELELSVRKPKLDWARPLLAEMGPRPPRTQTEVYAREQVLLDKMPPVRVMRLQAIRIGGLGIAAIPAEVFALTGLKIRRRSPLEPTFTLSLANGWDGYLPPPEQFVLGGYTTWLARSSCLEEQAEPKVVQAVLDLLAEVAGDARVARAAAPPSRFAAAVIATKPVAHWRLDEMEGPEAQSAVSAGPRGTFAPGVVFFLSGPPADEFPGLGPDSRAAHFAGGRMEAEAPSLGEDYSVELWFYNALPTDARPVTGYLFSRGPRGAVGAPGDHLGLGGTETAAGRLFFYNGDQSRELVTGRTDVLLRTWNHVALVRQGPRVAVYLNGQSEPELDGTAQVTRPKDDQSVFVGGRSDGFAGFEGKIAEVALFDRVLSAEEIARHYEAAVKAG